MESGKSGTRGATRGLVPGPLATPPNPDPHFVGECQQARGYLRVVSDACLASLLRRFSRSSLFGVSTPTGAGRGDLSGVLLLLLPLFSGVWFSSPRTPIVPRPCVTRTQTRRETETCRQLPTVNRPESRESSTAGGKEEDARGTCSRGVLDGDVYAAPRGMGRTLQTVGRARSATQVVVAAKTKRQRAGAASRAERVTGHEKNIATVVPPMPHHFCSL